METLDLFFNSDNKTNFLKISPLDKFELNIYLLKEIRNLSKKKVSLLLRYRLIDETFLNKNLGITTVFILLYDSQCFNTTQTIYILDNFKVNIHRKGGVSIYHIGAFKQDIKLLEHYIANNLNLLDDYDKTPFHYSKNEEILLLLKKTKMYDLALENVPNLTIEPIPSRLQLFFKNNNMDGLLSTLSPIKNYSKYKKYIFTDRLEYFNMGLLLINKECNFNSEILKKYLLLFLDSYLTSSERKLFISIFKKLNGIYTQKRLLDSLVQYVEDDDINLLQDLNSELDLLLKNNIKIPKFDSFRKLHNFTSIESSKLNTQLVQLDQTLPFTKLKFDNYILRIPKTNHDLIKAGSNLVICIGNGVYSNSVLNKEIYILFLYKDKKLVSCLELNSSFFITQARTYKNLKLDESLVEKIQDLIFKTLNIENPFKN